MYKHVVLLYWSYSDYWKWILRSLNINKVLKKTMLVYHSSITIQSVRSPFIIIPPACEVIEEEVYLDWEHLFGIASEIDDCIVL